MGPTGLARSSHRALWAAAVAMALVTVVALTVWAVAPPAGRPVPAPLVTGPAPADQLAALTLPGLSGCQKSLLRTLMHGLSLSGVTRSESIRRLVVLGLKSKVK